MAGMEINYINLITDLRKAGRSNKEELISILYRYNIPKIESLERRVLNYVFSINDDELRFKFFDMLAESNNLPIIHECYFVMYSNMPKEEFITNQVKNVGSSRDSLNLKYELCMKIIGQSSFLQSMQKTITESKVQFSNDPSHHGMKVINHKYRNRAARRD